MTAQLFDFRRPSKFSRDHARALQIVPFLTEISKLDEPARANALLLQVALAGPMSENLRLAHEIGDWVVIGGQAGADLVVEDRG